MPRVALVIGETNSLYQAICIRLAALKYRVSIVFNTHDQQQCEWLALLKAGGCDLQVYSCDITNKDEAIRRLASIEQQVGSIDALVMRTEYDHLESPFTAAKLVREGMVARGYGRIVVIDFPGEEQKNPRISPEGKMRSTQALRELAADLLDNKVTVNTITAGCIRKSSKTVSGDMVETGAESAHPTEHLSQRQEIAGLVAYLISDEAACITGANIAVNAGRYMD